MSLHLVIGPMFSGKSTEMIRQIRRKKVIVESDKILVINSNLDKRYSKESYIVNHDKEKEPCICVGELREINEELISKAETIFIEEGQFFLDLYDLVKHWVDNLEKEVIVFGLDGDFKRKPFEQILSLIPLCDTVKRLTSLCHYCHDGTTAIFSLRTSKDKSKISVGSADSYLPVCRKCYIKHSSY